MKREIGMTVYFDHRVQFPGSATSVRSVSHHLMSWHRIFSILAVSSKNEESDADGSVNFFMDEVCVFKCWVLGMPLPPNPSSDSVSEYGMGGLGILKYEMCSPVWVMKVFTA